MAFDNVRMDPHCLSLRSRNKNKIRSFFLRKGSLRELLSLGDFPLPMVESLQALPVKARALVSWSSSVSLGILLASDLGSSFPPLGAGVRESFPPFGKL